MSDKIETVTDERIVYLEGLVRQAKIAAAVFTQCTQEDVDRIVKPMVVAGRSERSISRAWPSRKPSLE
jgi:hypothetical protein